MSDPARRAQLQAIRLAALVREHLGGPEVVFESGVFPGGAALRVGPVAWVLVDEAAERSLGGALAWALRSGASSLTLVADHSTGLLARRASGFSYPIEVVHAEGRTLLPALAEPLVAEVGVSDHHRQFEAVILEAGAEVVHEHGVVAGEVDGLEVCRVVDDPALGVTRLEVGVGAHDREAFLLMHGDRPTATALADVVRSVATVRRNDVQGHPLARLAGERALRQRLVAQPGLLGATTVRPVSPPVPRLNLKDPTPCVAVARIEAEERTGGEAREVTVVCSTGVDLDVVPFTVDAMSATRCGAAVVVVPQRDALEIQHRLAALVRRPVAVVSVALA